MLACDLQNNTIVATAKVAEAGKNPETHSYLITCLQLFFSGMYGGIPEEDVLTNEAALKSGEGRILARYEAAEQLENDIYIIAYFSESNPGNIDFNNTTILYVDEY